MIRGTTPTGDPLPNTPTGSDNLTLGYQFNTLIDRVVDGIGVFDLNNDGLAQYHSVGLWKTDWQGNWILINQYAFDPAAPTCVSDSMWCWIPIPLLNLDRQTTYLIAATWDQSANPTDELAYRTPPPGTGKSYQPIDNALNYLFPVRSDPTAVDDIFGFGTCPIPSPLVVNFTIDINDPSTLCPFPRRRVDADAGGYFSAVVSFYTPASAGVPAPLPLLGASAMFAWRRRMRKRLLQAR